MSEWICTDPDGHMCPSCKHELILCKDCKHNMPEHEDNWRNYENACFEFADYEGTPACVEPDGFCKWGERRED